MLAEQSLATMINEFTLRVCGSALELAGVGDQLAGMYMYPRSHGERQLCSRDDIGSRLNYELVFAEVACRPQKHSMGNFEAALSPAHHWCRTTMKLRSGPTLAAWEINRYTVQFVINAGEGESDHLSRMRRGLGISLSCGGLQN
jgi:hypothetical protein